jgi:cell fate (sporulation/competence/biofilm development) regulator YlbF (YheA/YmcA/DUF963 family)
MTKIIELAHNLGEEIAKSEEIKNLNTTKNAFDADEALQNKMREYEAERLLLGQEYAKEEGEADEKAIANLKARIEELTAEISTSPVYIAFAEAQKAFDEFAAANPKSFLKLTAQLGAARCVAAGGDKKKALERLEALKAECDKNELAQERIAATVTLVKRYEAKK